MVVFGPGVVQSIYRLDDRSSIPGMDNDGVFSLCHHVQTSSGYQGL